MVHGPHASIQDLFHKRTAETRYDTACEASRVASCVGGGPSRRRRRLGGLISDESAFLTLLLKNDDSRCGVDSITNPFWGLSSAKRSLGETRHRDHRTTYYLGEGFDVAEENTGQETRVSYCGGRLGTALTSPMMSRSLLNLL